MLDEVMLMLPPVMTHLGVQSTEVQRLEECRSVAVMWLQFYLLATCKENIFSGIKIFLGSRINI